MNVRCVEVVNVLSDFLFIYFLFFRKIPPMNVWIRLEIRYVSFRPNPCPVVYVTVLPRISITTAEKHCKLIAKLNPMFSILLYFR